MIKSIQTPKNHMRVFKSFLLRLSCCLSVTFIFCLLLMAGTFKLQYLDEKAIICVVLALAVSPISITLFKRIKARDPELTSIVAAYLHPAEGLLSLALCYLMGAILISQLPEPGNQHLMFIMAKKLH